MTDLVLLFGLIVAVSGLVSLVLEWLLNRPNEAARLEVESRLGALEAAQAVNLMGLRAELDLLRAAQASRPQPDARP